AADNITILRDGQFVASCAASETDAVRLAEMMIGRSGESGEFSLVTAEPREFSKDTPLALKVSHLSVDMPGEVVKDVSFEVHEGEIFGIGGLAGQGKIGVPNGIMGVYEAEGDVEFMGQKVKLNDARAALSSGMAMVSED